MYCERSNHVMRSRGNSNAHLVDKVAKPNSVPWRHFVHELIQVLSQIYARVSRCRIMIESRKQVKIHMHKQTRNLPVCCFLWSS
jgi:hypothetical protein